MKVKLLNRFLALSLLGILIVSCEKEDLDPLQPIAVVDTFEDIYDIDYTLTSYETRIPFPEVDYTYRVFHPWHPPLEAVIFDYNGDGYLDVIDHRSDYGNNTTNKILFLKGTPEGTLIKDTANSDKIEGLVHGRKGLTGDFNGDGLPDAFFMGHGYDGGNFPGEYPILLLNSPSGKFTVQRFQSTIGFFHGGASGDVDNDGDLDIIIISGTSPQNSTVFENQGNGQFQLTSIQSHSWFSSSNIVSNLGGKFTMELYDLNQDSYLDIVLAGHDNSQWDTNGAIYFGSSTGFSSTPTYLPKDTTFGITTDIDFFDLNQDGAKEIILQKTTHEPFYQEFSVRVIDGVTFQDTSELYFTNNQNDGGPYSGWIYWLSIYQDTTGAVVLRGDDMRSNHKWILNSQTGFFVKQ